MTEIASGVPAQRSDDSTPASTAPPEDVSPATAGAPPASSSASALAVPAPAAEPARPSQSTVDAAVERAHEVAERVGERAGEVAVQVGDAVTDAVERAAQASGRVAAAVVDRLRNNAELAAERGTTTIADEVVEKIAGIATREIPGVYDLGGDVARLFATVKERIGLGEADEDNRGIKVRLEGGTAAITITLVIEYGFVVHAVTEKVRAKVISAVENLLGLDVTEVNIVVDDVHYVEPAAHDAVA